MGRPSCPALVASFTVACILLFFGLSQACPVISEVHPKGVEWIEIENSCNAALNLSEWFIADNNSVDEITCTGIEGCTLETDAGYFLTIGRNINLSNVTDESVPYFFTDDKMIGNGLSDSGDAVRFYNATYASSMSYASSSENSWSFCNGTWVETNATPGHANDCPANATEEPQEPPQNDTQDNETADEDHDFGDIHLSVESPSGSFRFGDFAVVKALLYTGNAESEMRVVAYLRSPKAIANDLDGNTIYANLNETDTKTALLLRGVTKGENMTLFVPIFLKSNCEGDFPEGGYSGYVNVYEEGTGEKAASGSFNMTISGNNPLFCCEECEECKKCECKKSSCTSGASAGASVTAATAAASAPKKKVLKYFDVEWVASTVAAGERAFSANITIKNTLSAGADFTAYSYVYNGSSCLSLGRAPSGWVKGWDANGKTVAIAAGGREGLKLESMIPEDVQPGTYSYRIRVRFGDEREDATFTIAVTEAREEPAASETALTEPLEDDGSVTDEMPTENATMDGAPVTGMAAAKGGGQKDAFSLFYEAIASFFGLFKF